MRYSASMQRPSLGSLLAVSFVLLAACSASSDDDDDELGAGEDVDAGGIGSSSGGARDSGTPQNDASTPRDDASAPVDAASDAPEPDCVVVGVPGDCIEESACAEEDSHRSTAGRCEGTGETVQCCTPFGLALCDPAVTVLPNEGHTTEAAGEGGCPDGMIPVEDYCVDKFEASLVKVSGGSWSPYDNPGSTEVRAVSVQGAVPQGYINGVQAADACANAGKRLCSNTEWKRACGGPDGTTYPYGDTREPGVCNDHREQHPAVQYFGTTDSEIYSHIDNACLNQLPISLDPAGTRAGCVTVEGALDMMGNLHEWTDDPAGTFRGGFYVDTVLNGNGCNYATTAHDTGHWDYSTGFRCCADP